jgi:predicted alpha/beta-hydrolase family hydrolase
MTAFARGLSARGIDVMTFDFPYMAAKRRIPDRGATLETSYREAIEFMRREVASAERCLFIGGKSMGGRIATQLAVDRDLPIAGIVLLGYPLHPPGRPSELRTAHLPLIRRPMLIVQGSRDAFGTPSELRNNLAALSPPPVLHVVEGGDHSLKISRRDTALQSRSDDEVQRRIAEWMMSVSRADDR